MTTLRLHGSLTSPYVRHCRIALVEAKLGFELIETNQTQSAQQIATARVPYLETGKYTLTDSASILRYIRESAEQTFMPSVEDFDHFCFINTALDASANVFYLEKFGLSEPDNDYITRQNLRIQSIVKRLNEHSFLDAIDVDNIENNDVALRLANYLDWSQFRQRLNLSPYRNLQDVLTNAQQYSIFAQTQPTEAS